MAAEVDQQLLRGRLVLAWLTTPAVAIVTLTMIASTFTVIAGELPLRLWPAASVHFLFVMALFGAPVAYAVEFLVGLPAYALMRARGKLRLAGVLGVSVFAGMLGLSILVVGRSWTAGDTAAMIIIGGGGSGTIAGLWFWWVAFAGNGPPNTRLERTGAQGG